MYWELTKVWSDEIYKNKLLNKSDFKRNDLLNINNPISKSLTYI